MSSTDNGFLIKSENPARNATSGGSLLSDIGSDLTKFGKSLVGPGLEALGIARFGWSDGVTKDVLKQSLIAPRGHWESYTIANGIDGYYFFKGAPFNIDNVPHIINDVNTRFEKIVTEHTTFNNKNFLYVYGDSLKRMSITIEYLLGNTYKLGGDNNTIDNTSYNTSNNTSVKEVENKVEAIVTGGNGIITLGSLINGKLEDIYLTGYEKLPIEKETHTIKFRLSGYVVRRKQGYSDYDYNTAVVDKFKSQTTTKGASTGSKVMGRITGAIDGVMGGIGGAIGIG